MIVYIEARPSDTQTLRKAHFPVLAIALPELLEQMRTSSFAKVVRNLRNRSVQSAQVVTAIDQAEIARLFRIGEQAPTAIARGRALEELIAYLFELIPGISITARNHLNALEAEEIDVAFWNEGEPDGLRMFDHLIVVECKNWSGRVGYAELAVFNDKLTSRGGPLGILVAANGITGDPAAMTAAHSVIARALANGREILVRTRLEIESLADTDQLVRMLKRKRAQLAVAGTSLPT